MTEDYSNYSGKIILDKSKNELEKIKVIVLDI